MRQEKCRGRWKLLFVLVIMLCASCITLRPSTPEIPSVPGASYVGSEKCIECHQEIGSDFKKNVHNRLAPFELKGHARGCESCHGPGSLHAGSCDVKKILCTIKLLPQQGSEICLSCHRESSITWDHSVHVSEEVSCADCHKMHSPVGRKLLKAQETDLCYTCHREKQAQMSFPSHHPLREGKMKCSSCHNVHGPEKGYMSRGTINDLCYNCHAEFQGPFVFEHPPVAEDCSICHDPHGTVAHNLLKQNDPFLCLRCHRGHLYQSPSHPDKKQSAFMTSCIQCHSTIHGTDLPSRSSGEGRFTR